MPTEQARRFRTFRFRMHPTFHQKVALAQQLEYQRELYNAALEEHVGAWEWERRSVTYVDQCRTLTELRSVRPELLTSGATLCRGTLKRVNWAFDAFYERVKHGETPGYPRFKSARRYSSLQWEDAKGWKLKVSESRLYVMGIGEIRVNLHRPIIGVPKAITVKREGEKWWLSLRCADIPAEPLPPTGREVGIDLGVVNLVATSDGGLFVGEQFGMRASSRLSLAQQKRDRQILGSNRRRRQAAEVARLHRKVANQRANAAHQLSRRLVNDYDFISMEELAIKEMARAPKSKPNPDQEGAFLPNGAAAKATLNHAIHDAGWGILKSLLLYKAESAGRVVVMVDPHYTSQTCAECGHVDAGNRVSQAVFRCLGCGHEDHADLNAARNILRAGRARQARACDG